MFAREEVLSTVIPRVSPSRSYVALQRANIPAVHVSIGHKDKEDNHLSPSTKDMRQQTNKRRRMGIFIYIYICLP